MSTTTGRFAPGQTLIFDADDTLWENNAYFERAIGDFLDWLAHPTLDRSSLRGIIDDVERAAAAGENGYGSAAFLRNLHEVFRRLHQRGLTDTEQADVERMAGAVLEHRAELYAGVADTLAELGTRHDLKLMTKGVTAEQQAKIDASGLAPSFSSIHIVPEKHPQAYRDVISAQALDVSSSWMIGNSPKSDILPARAAGLRAVFLPNAGTWVLEHAELDDADDGVLTLGGFAELARLF
ncbi:HAD family hydrolase [Nakamurella aerolata]|uniref:HAD family hydrolase n=1 Tax=Nakamurella aerolata TaxID=1656892 RepID=UPI001BB10004